MTLSVAERGRRIATFRFVSVRLMETAAAWTPTTPEMEVKVLLGRHIWDFAQHADALGRRTLELRLPVQHSLPPDERYLALLQELVGLSATAERLAGLYDVVLPGLDRRLAEYAAQADAIVDEPSLLIVERIRRDLDRQRVDAGRLREDLGLPSPPLQPLRARESAVPDLLAGARA
jgi:hypothetical protein